MRYKSLFWNTMAILAGAMVITFWIAAAFALCYVAVQMAIFAINLLM